MYLSQLVNRIRWSSAALACLTMAFSPLATAKESENISRTQIENYLKVSGLNKKITWSQFFENTRDYYPEDVAAKIGEFVKMNPDLEMPQVKLKSAQNSQGDAAAVLEISDNNKTYTTQIAGQPENWAKISGIVLKESDIENPERGLQRLQTGNIFFKKQADAYFAKHNLLPDQKHEEMISNLSLFRSFPRMTPQLWSSMTKAQRKQFINQIAQVWQAAEAVLNSTTENSKKTSLLENYLRFFLVSEALADEPSSAPASGAPAQSTQQRTIERMVSEMNSNPDLLRAYQSGTWTVELDRWLVQFEVTAERRAQEVINQCLARPSATQMESAEVKRRACEEFGRQLLINETVISQFRGRACRAPAQYAGLYVAGESAPSRDQKDQLNRRDVNVGQDQLCACSGSNQRVKFNEECSQAAAASAVQPAETPSQPESSAAGSERRRSGSSFWPLFIGGAALGVLAGLLFSGKDKKKSRTTAAENTPPQASCPANKIGTPPNCSCGPCTAPQQVYNFVTCQCTNVTSNVICPNNEMAPNGDSSKCLKCSDGTYKTTEPCPQITQPAQCAGANCGGVRPALQ